MSLSLNQKKPIAEKKENELEKNFRQIIENLEEENEQYQQTVTKLQNQSDYYQSRVKIKRIYSY